AVTFIVITAIIILTVVVVTIDVTTLRRSRSVIGSHLRFYLKLLCTASLPECSPPHHSYRAGDHGRENN
ncbi:hypothetical protein A2U01_0101980, partial [Trifolium medium]|nr:hypothetical protein [Trifolium medium]